MALNCVIIYTRHQAFPFLAQHTRHTGIPNRLLVIKRNSDWKVPINNLLCKNLEDANGSDMCNSK